MNKLKENYRTLTPAYGRDFGSQKKAVAAFHANLDWYLQPEGVLINMEQIEPGTIVNLRFGALRKVTPAKALAEPRTAFAL